MAVNNVGSTNGAWGLCRLKRFVFAVNSTAVVRPLSRCRLFGMCHYRRSSTHKLNPLDSTNRPSKHTRNHLVVPPSYRANAFVIILRLSRFFFFWFFPHRKSRIHKCHGSLFPPLTRRFFTTLLFLLPARVPFGYCAVSLYCVHATTNGIRQSRIVRPLDIVYQWRTIIYLSKENTTISVSLTLSTVQLTLYVPFSFCQFFENPKSHNTFFFNLSQCPFLSLLLNVLTSSDVRIGCTS